MTFADFMQAALYDPDEGFYSGSPVGPAGHFVTSPHVSSLFGALVARQVEDAWETLDRPAEMQVVELGAGDGTLAVAVLASLHPDARSAVRYVAVEQSAGARARIMERGIDAHPSIEAMGSIAGLIFANELLDNLPFHRLRHTGDRIVEVVVDVDEEDLVESEADPSPAVLSALRAELQPGEERPVSPPVFALLGSVVSRLDRGYALFFDYGVSSGGGPHGVRAFAGGRLFDDVLADPGSRDVTGGVDWVAIAGEARRLGCQVWGPVAQREALHLLGFRTMLDELRDRQLAAERDGDARLAIRLFGERSAASILTDPSQLGGHYVLALGTAGLPPPRAFR